jgi:flagellar biosynthesis chaperone FliJ
MIVDPSSSKEIQENYLQILDDISRKIVDVAKAAGRLSLDLQQPPSIQIFTGSKKVYEQVPGQEPTKNIINDEQVKQIEQALEDPQNLKGSVRIKIGKELVFHAVDGEVITDKLGLAPSQTQAAKATCSLETSTVEKPLTPEAQITALGAIVEKQGQRIEVLEQKLEQLSSSLTSVQVNNPILRRWMNAINNSLSSSAQELKEKVVDFARHLQDKAASQVQNLQNKVVQQAQNLQGQAINTIDNAVKTVQRGVADFNGNLVKAAVEKMLDRVGQVQPDGSRIFEGTKYAFYQQNGVVSVVAKDGRGTILKDSEFTANASAQDMASLKSLSEDVKQDFGQQQAQSQSRGRSR